MNIGFDAKRLFLNFTGLGNYSRNLVGRYHASYPEDRLTLFTTGIKEEARTLPFTSDPGFQIVQPKGWKPLWRSLELTNEIARSGIQVYHGLSHELPMGLARVNAGKVVTIHDLIFKYYPEDHSWFDRQIYDWKWKHACITADVIIAISHQTREDIIRYYDVRPEKIEVIYQGTDPLFSSPVRDDDILNVRKKYNLPESYLLYVGSVISRKNLITIIRAMNRIPAGDRLPLVIIGKGGSYAETVKREAEQLGLTPFLIWLGSPSFADFPSIYKGARMMIYPSFYEGFGLPVVEAMAVGIPVITSNQSSLKEAGGDAAFLIDPASPDELAHAIQTVQSDETRRQQMIEKGYGHAHRIGGSDSLHRHRLIYQSLCP